MARPKSILINVGFDNVVSAERIVAITAAGPKPMRRLISEARKVNRLVDATNGRKTRSIIVTDSNHIVLSASEPKTLVQRVNET